MRYVKLALLVFVHNHYMKLWLQVFGQSPVSLDFPSCTQDVIRNNRNDTHTSYYIRNYFVMIVLICVLFAAI